MITPALIAEEVRTSSYRRVARARGLTVGKVAGLVRKSRAMPGADRANRPDSPVKLHIIDLMADGRMRTTNEIAERLSVRPATALYNLHQLVLSGAAARLGGGAGSMPAIWQEAPE
jgi:hypothetical protein